MSAIGIASEMESNLSNLNMSFGQTTAAPSGYAGTPNLDDNFGAVTGPSRQRRKVPGARPPLPGNTNPMLNLSVDDQISRYRAQTDGLRNMKASIDSLQKQMSMQREQVHNPSYARGTASAAGASPQLRRRSPAPAPLHPQQQQGMGSTSQLRNAMRSQLAQHSSSANQTANSSPFPMRRHAASSGSSPVPVAQRVASNMASRTSGASLVVSKRSSLPLATGVTSMTPGGSASGSRSGSMPKASRERMDRNSPQLHVQFGAGGAAGDDDYMAKIKMDLDEAERRLEIERKKVAAMKMRR